MISDHQLLYNGNSSEQIYKPAIQLLFFVFAWTISSYVTTLLCLRYAYVFW